MLTDEQLDRYARHIVLKEIGGEGQKTLLRSTVVVIGAGGIGCPVTQYLAAAGVGRVRVIDDDVVSLDNLQRQILFGTADVGRPKTEVTGEAVARLNPDTAFDGRPVRLSSANVAGLLEGADVVIDGCDNFATRLIVSDEATRARIPLVSAAIGRFQIQIGTYRGWLPDLPCYRCYVGDAFDADDCDTCAELGVLGAAAGVAGTWAALEGIRVLTGFGDRPEGRVHIFDALKPAMRSVRIIKDPACRGCSGVAEAGTLV